MCLHDGTCSTIYVAGFSAQVCDSGLCAEEDACLWVGDPLAGSARCSTDAPTVELKDSLNSCGPFNDGAAACRCRSEFSDDFQDARGFGWEIRGQPKFHWKTLIQKKVLVHEAHEHDSWCMCTASAKLLSKDKAFHAGQHH